MVVGVDAGKSRLYAALKLTEHGPGYCHFPAGAGYDAEFYKQLTAEEVRLNFRRGFAKREWHKAYPRNESLDCRVYAHAALLWLNPDWPALERNVAKLRPDPPEERKLEVIKSPAPSPSSGPSASCPSSSSGPTTFSSHRTYVPGRSFVGGWRRF
jgi:phage terminase large subunit GpA-like protein